MTQVAFQGVEGAYSQEAISQHFGDGVETIPCRTLTDLFAAVESGQTEFGAVPVENSVAGSINQSYDLLLERDLRVSAEVLLRVRHCLMAPEGTAPEEIRQVRSHPQALAQCERYLTERDWEPVAAFDTAGSAEELATHPEPGVAAIASKLAAQRYGLSVLAAGIEDQSWNYTRFFIVGQASPEPTGRDKTSLVFAAAHEPGALFQCLGEFARRDINLTKLESRPRRNRPWHYVFYLDFAGHWQDKVCSDALVALLSRSAFVKLLGSYPAAPQPDQGNGNQP